MNDFDTQRCGGLPPDCYDTWNRHHSVAFSSAKGLQNAPGENNCFVNSAVQVFWHLDVFRRSYRRIMGHTCMGDSCIFCSLKVIFTQFQYSDKSSLTPDNLRTALAETFADQQRFQLGRMDDAAECFENILRRIHYHIATNHNEDACDAPHCIPHQKFAMTVVDQVTCQCGAKTDPLKFQEFVHYISAKSLILQARSLRESKEIIYAEDFGIAVRKASPISDYHPCTACGKQSPMRRTLLNLPDVVSIGLIWHCERPNPVVVSDVVKSIGSSIRLQDVFHKIDCADTKSLPRLHLTAVVCYFGKHYSTFVYHSKMQSWIYFDDATVKPIGPDFQSVRDKCCKSKYQPLLLLYTNPQPQILSGETAMIKTVMAPHFSQFTSTPHTRRKSKLSENSETRNKITLSRRSVTPNPDVRLNSVEPSRRAVTPGPMQLNMLSHKGTAIVDHSRQQSFLTAMNQKSSNYGINNNNHKTRTSGGGSVTRQYSSSDASQYSQDFFDGEVLQNSLRIADYSDIKPNPQKYVQFTQNLNRADRSSRSRCNAEVLYSPPHTSLSVVERDCKRTPVESGYATLPRRREQLVTKCPDSDDFSKDVFSHERQSSASSSGSVILNPAYRGSDPGRNDYAHCLSNEDDQRFHSRQSSSMSSCTLTENNTKDFSKFDSAPNTSKMKVTNNSEHHKVSNYIDRRVVQSVLNQQGLQRQPSTASSSSFHSATSGSSYMSQSAIKVRDIAYDKLSIESQIDSGYHGSDRNSSSSNSSESLNPLNLFLLKNGMVSIKQTPAKGHYNPVSDHSKNGFGNPDSQMRKNHVQNYSSRDIYEQKYQLTQESSSHGDELGSRTFFEEGRFNELMTESEEYMDKCVLAETRPDIREAKDLCQAAIGCLEKAMQLPHLSKKLILFAQDEHDSCNKKYLSLKQALETSKSSTTNHNSSNRSTKSPKTTEHQKYMDSSPEAVNQREEFRTKLQQYYHQGSPAVSRSNKISDHATVTGMMKFVKTNRTKSTENMADSKCQNSSNTKGMSSKSALKSVSGDVGKKSMSAGSENKNRMSDKMHSSGINHVHFSNADLKCEKYKSQPDLSQSSRNDLSVDDQSPVSPTQHFSSVSLKCHDINLSHESQYIKDKVKSKKHGQEVRKRSKSESNSSKKSRSGTKTVYKTPKCVTFRKEEIPFGQPPPPYSVAAGIECDNRPLITELKSRQKIRWDHDERELTKAVLSQFSDGSDIESNIETSDDLCRLCNKRPPATHSSYCSNCGFYVSQFAEHKDRFT